MSLTLIAFSLSPSAWARGYGQTGDHSITVGAGYSSPSDTTALTENPSALVFNNRPLLSGAAETEQKNFNPWTAEAGLFLGNGQVGAGVAVDHLMKSGNPYYVAGGLAAQIEPLHTALGITCGGTTDNSIAFACNAVGIMITPANGLRLGATGYNLINSSATKYYGFGVSIPANTYATISLDGSTDSQGKGSMFEPALGIALSSLELMGGYGFSLDSNSQIGIRQGAQAGLGFKLGPQMHVEAYYNHLAHYFLALTLLL